MKNNLEDKNSYKSLTFNQFLCWAKDPPSSLVNFLCRINKKWIKFQQTFKKCLTK